MNTNTTKFEFMQQQKQSLTLSPKMQETLRILRMDALDLTDYLNNAALENPLLDVEVKSEQIPGGADIDYAYGNQRVDDGYGKLYPPSDAQDTGPVWENIYRPQRTLYDHLLEQAGFIKTDRETERALRFVIYSLLENGYMSITIEELSRISGISEERLNRAFTLVRSMSPAGVGAASLADCLILQLEGLGEDDDIAIALVENYLEQLKDGAFKSIAAEIGVAEAVVLERYGIIKGLNPSPGSGFAGRQGEMTKYIVADVVVEEENGTLLVKINDATVPEIKIRYDYIDFCSTESQSNDEQAENTKKYLKKALQEAEFLISAVNKRKNTLLSLTGVVINRQMDFFRKGVTTLAPMTMAEIAEELNLSPSTVSRAINGKYIECPQGIYPFRYFFSRRIEKDDGSDISALAVHEKIKSFVASENKRAPLSDQKLCDRLIAEGYAISRRTVAKYREQLSIPPSKSRKSMA